MDNKILEDYIYYHIYGDCNVNCVVLRGYADSHSLDINDRFSLAYFFSITYCVATSIYLLQNKHDLKRCAQDKSMLIFQSDRKYVKMGDRFDRLLDIWSNCLNNNYADVFENITVNGRIDVNKAVRYVSSWYYFGRYSAFLFLETLASLLDIPINECSNLISYGNDRLTFAAGIYMIFGQIDYAEYANTHHKVPTSVDYLNSLLKTIMDAINCAGGESNILSLETSLCAFYKHYKGSRYNGYYADRMLSELREYDKKNLLSDIVAEIYRLRETLINHKMLGEKNGWDGIRKELCDSYLKYGRVIRY